MSPMFYLLICVVLFGATCVLIVGYRVRKIADISRKERIESIKARRKAIQDVLSETQKILDSQKAFYAELVKNKVTL